MKKVTIKVGAMLMLAATMSMSMTSCIGSFALTNRVLSWNKTVSSKFINEVVFFAFWVLPVYEVTSLADLVVLNSIEFWSGSNPAMAYSKTVDTDHGQYKVVADATGYSITHVESSTTVRIEHEDATDTWGILTDEGLVPFMTMVDDNHVKMITPSGDFRMVELSESGVLAYQEALASPTMACL